MDATMVFVSGAVYIAAWLIREYQWSIERNKMLDRIMAKSLPEFKHEVRKEDRLKKKPEPRPFPSDSELADWERKHFSQVAENTAALDVALSDLKKKAVSTIGG